MKILLVEDNNNLALNITEYFESKGYVTDYAADGITAFSLLLSETYDVIVLDIMLPGMDGFSLCQKLRDKKGNGTPVIMLTARGEEIDRVLGLEVGADDYLVKPFSFRELLARIQAILRRVELDQQADPSKPIVVGSIRLEVNARQVFKDTTEVQVSAREFDVLTTLMTNIGQAMSRERLISEVF